MNISLKAAILEHTGEKLIESCHLLTGGEMFMYDCILMVNIHVNISFVKGALYDFTILATEAQENRIHFATLPSQSMIVNTGIAYRMFLIYLFCFFFILFCLSVVGHVNARLV